MVYYRDYPDDVDVVVTYVAPLNFSIEDPRIDRFLNHVGTAYCRDKLRQFQRAIFKRKHEVLPLFKSITDKEGYTYSISHEKAFELCVLEYPFSFWQYEKIDCQTIPGDEASPEELLHHSNRVVSFHAYSDARMNSTSMFQFATESGYYGYVRNHVKDLLSDTDYNNTDFAPQNVDITFNQKVMKDLNDWLQINGNNMIYIYGEFGSWSGSSVEVSEQTNALKMIFKGGNHFTYIKTFPKEEQEKILSTLEAWLDAKIQREN